jgi:phage terminase large subunit GpA-like protein
MYSIDHIGEDWVNEQYENRTYEVERIKPSDYNEKTRYLPASVTSMPGYIRFDVNPYMKEIVDCFDINSPVREVNVMKGVQITYTTLLESGILYYADHVGVLPMMYMTADKELATARIENNLIPMFQQSDKAHIIRSSDEGNTRKSGKTANHLQFAKGAYLVPFGARNADKMRSYSIAIMLKDEIDAWPETVGRDGDPDALSDARTDGYSETSKIFRGSTPLIKSSSKIYKNYLKGDQRKYMVLCKSCSYPQELRWYTENKENGIIGGFDWQMEDGILIPESVHYGCFNCGHKHYDHDKEFLYSPKNGAHWKATAKPVSYGVRSYHLPALYSPVGMRPWSKNVLQYIEAYDRDEKKVKDIGKYQVFYNNVLAMPFEVKGAAIRFSQVSSHRRQIYRLGQVPNNYAKDYSRSKILFLTCQIDVHKSNLAVSIMGWCKDAICYVIDYVRIEVENDDKDCSEIDSPVWNKVRELIEEKIYIADDGTSYNIAITLIDAGYANDTVTTFCSEYAGGVFPILGRDRAAKNQTIKEFAEFKTQAGTVGYRILVDHYKDRMGPVLRREWYEDFGEQKPYHFNAPVDITDKQLKELTVETRKEKIDDKGHVSYFWHRPGNARNELFDLLGYGYAATEILAWNVCIQTFELETIDWARFWEYLETEALYFKDDVKVNDDKT